MIDTVRALLISTYDLGRQPFGLASPAAWLRRAGIDVECADLSRARLSDEAIAAASFVGFYLPMHTATRLALPVIDRVRRLNPAAALAAFGLYAPLNESLLRSRGVSIVLGPEFEDDLVSAIAAGTPQRAGTTSGPEMPAQPAKLRFITPDRSGLPGLQRYASLRMPDGSARIVGATDATRGCKHRCRHCPIVPVYDGAFRVVPLDVVIGDIRAQVEQGAGHITFGDPDFFNGPRHSARLVESLHKEWPHLSYDVTIKVEHLLRHRDLLPVLAGTGCAFVTSAVESVDDGVLVRLEKGHTRRDFVEAVGLCRQAGLALSPTFVAFTPWTSLDGYRDLLETVASLGLVEHVSPVQWGIRLLVTAGSRLLELDDIRSGVGAFDEATLTYPWRHDDPHVDDLQARVMTLVGVRARRPRAEVFAAVRAMANSLEPASEEPALPVWHLPARAAIPYLDEPWYC